MLVERGQIYDAFLDPVFGRELGGYKARPVVVISINDTNRTLSLPITIVPGTSDKGGRIDYKNIAVVRRTPGNGLEVPTIFRGDQVRAIDRGRLFNPRGRLSEADLRAVIDAVKYNLGIVDLPIPGGSSRPQGRPTPEDKP